MTHPIQTQLPQPTSPAVTPNGPAAAAILACSLGCFALGGLAVAADGSKRLAGHLAFYHPTGPLSGVTTVAIAFWLLCWAVFAARWRKKTVALGRVSALASLFLLFGLLLTFPPFGDLLLGR
jgi:hypothetical protein